MSMYSLRNRLALSYVIPLLLLVIMAVLSLSTINTLNNQYHVVADQTVNLVQALEEMKIAGIRVISSTNEYALDVKLEIDEGAAEAEEGEGQGELTQIAQEIQAYETAFAAYQRYIASSTTDVADTEQSIVSASETLFDTSEALIAATNDDDAAALAEAREQFETAEEVFISAVNQVITAENAGLDQAQIATEAAASTSVWAQIIVAALSILIAGFSARLVFRSISQPLDQVRQTLLRFETGDLSARVGLTSRDEIGALSKAFDNMATSLQQRERALAEANEALEHQLVEVQAARDEAQRANQAKSSFLSTVSHELRTPLNAIINFSRFVADELLGSLNDEQKDMLGRVTSNGKHLLDLINDVLDMSKIDSGSLRLFLEDDVSLEPIIKTAVKNSTGLLIDKPVQIETEVPDDLPLIRADKQRVQQILLNILSNACKFTDSGVIRVKAYQQNQSIQIAISDSGPGIPAEDFELVFTPFKQTETGIRSGGGTGLGMPISRSLAEAHGGSIKLESQPGHGSTFTLVLPTDLVAVAQPAPLLQGAMA